MSLFKNNSLFVNFLVLFRYSRYLLPFSMLPYLPLSRRYPLWLGYLISCLYWIVSLPHISLLMVLSVLGFYLFTLAVFDADYFLLPDSLTFGLLSLGFLINNSPYGIISSHKAFYGFLGSFVFFYSIYLLGYFIYQHCVLGFGDVKLFSAIGVWCGLELLPHILLLASLFGLMIYGGIRIATKERITKIAFGSCLAFATLIILYINLKYGLII